MTKVCMSIRSYSGKLFFKSLLVFRVRIHFVVRKMRPLGHIDSGLLTLLMQCNLFPLIDDTNQMLVPPDRYFFSHQMAGNGIVRILKMNMTIHTHSPYSPVEKRKCLSR